MKKIEKELEYEDAPCGYVKLYNYKEPFMKFEEGFGYQGVLLFDGETDKIQCHFCGEWYGALANHIAKEHNMRVSEYKDIIGLSQTTALISESMRGKLIASGLNQRLKNLKPGIKKTEEQKKKISETLKKKSTELKNLRGTCPLQILSKMRASYDKLGRTPVEGEWGVSIETIEATYGTLKDACDLAGVPYRKPGQTMRMWTEERAIDYFYNFLEGNGRLPNYKDNVSLFKLFTKGKFNRKEVIRKAVLKSDNYYKDLNLRYQPDDLLEMLRKFKKINLRKPSYSDCKRGLLPHLSRYSYYFGSWKNALTRAFNNNEN